MYTTKNYEHLLGVQGFSDDLLKNHFKLYSGYVSNMNKLNDVLVKIEKEEKWGTPEFAELNRRLGWEFNGMRLHELYFGNMTKDYKDLSADTELFKKIEKELKEPSEGFVKFFSSQIYRSGFNRNLYSRQLA